MIVLSPEGKARTSSERMAALPRFADLNGKTVGLLDNSKPNNDMLQARFEQLLRQNCDVAGVLRRRKLTAQQGAPKAYLDDLAAHADFVISGLGDWGSCTSWSIHDSIELQKRGRLAVTVISHPFEALAKSEREAFGAPDSPIVIVQHPIGTVKAEEVKKRADAAFGKLLEALLDSHQASNGESRTAS
jgi:hypothetical protein